MKSANKHTYNETGHCFECDKPEKRSAYRERTGKATYGLEVYAYDKARMRRWLKENGYTQAEGLKVLLDAVKAI